MGSDWDGVRLGWGQTGIQDRLGWGHTGMGTDWDGDRLGWGVSTGTERVTPSPIPGQALSGTCHALALSSFRNITIPCTFHSGCSDSSRHDEEGN